MGYLMRRNILAYKAPPGNEGYDLVCIHPDPRYYYRKQPILTGQKHPEIYTLPADFIRQHHRTSQSGWEKVMTKNLDLQPYSDESGFELIANDLGIAYPGM